MLPSCKFVYAILHKPVKSAYSTPANCRFFTTPHAAIQPAKNKKRPYFMDAKRRFPQEAAASLRKVAAALSAAVTTTKQQETAST